MEHEEHEHYNEQREKLTNGGDGDSLVRENIGSEGDSGIAILDVTQAILPVDDEINYIVVRINREGDNKTASNYN